MQQPRWSVLRERWTTTLKKTEETLAADLATRVGEKEAEIMQGHMMLSDGSDADR